jgi:hypothetical protein
VSEPVTRDYYFSFKVPSGYRDARNLAPEPWKRASTEILSCRVWYDSLQMPVRVQGTVRYTVKGNTRHDIVRKIEGAAKKLGIEIEGLEVERVS